MLPGQPSRTYHGDQCSCDSCLLYRWNSRMSRLNRPSDPLPPSPQRAITPSEVACLVSARSCISERITHQTDCLSSVPPVLPSPCPVLSFSGSTQGANVNGDVLSREQSMSTVVPNPTPEHPSPFPVEALLPIFQQFCHFLLEQLQLGAFDSSKSGTSCINKRLDSTVHQVAANQIAALLSRTPEYSTSHRIRYASQHEDQCESRVENAGHATTITNTNASVSSSSTCDLSSSHPPVLPPTSTLAAPSSFSLLSSTASPITRGRADISLAIDSIKEMLDAIPVHTFAR